MFKRKASERMSGGMMMAKKTPSLKEVADAAGWVIGIAGFVVFLFGLMLFLNPAKTVEESVFFLGFVLFVAGLLKLAEGLLYSKGSDAAGFFVAVGLLAAIIGLIMFLSPAAVTGGVLLTFGFIALLLAFLALVSGIGQIMLAMKRKKKAVPMLIGLLYILLGLFMLFNPLAATLALVSLLGLFAIIYGALLVAIAMSMRNFFP
jgi:uncharacterized membrane protein HdeD (DUF308 family)